MEDVFIKKITEITETNLTNHQFGVSMLAKEMGMSRSNLHRKVKSVLNISASKFIRRIRLKHAMELLKDSGMSISEIAYHVGFGSVTYFSTCFHNFFGYPPGEVEKRDSTQNEIEKDNILKAKPIKNKKRLYSIASLFILIVVIQAIIIYFVFKPFTFGANKKLISIAVLPISYDGQDDDYSGIINGLRDDLIAKLDIIEDLNVVSRTTSDKIKDSDKTIKEISRFFKVDYVLEGNGQKINDHIKIRFRLIEAATETNLWSKPYERELKDEDIQKFQDEVALMVANELNAVVTEKEKDQITIPETENMAAYKLHKQGKNFLEVHEQMQYSNQNIIDKSFKPLEMAKSRFQKALKLDSTYSKVYTSLGWYYHTLSEIYILDALISDNYLDSALNMANKAIYFDPNDAGAYNLQSCILAHKGLIAELEKSSEKLISLNQNNWNAYYRVADNNYLMNNYSSAIRYFNLARKLNKEPLEDIRTLKYLYSCMVQSGFGNEAKYFLDLLLAQENDSVDYYNSLKYKEFCAGNLKQALHYQLMAYSLDTLNADSHLQLSVIYLTLRNQDEMLFHFRKYQSKLKESQKSIDPNKYLGYFQLLAGNTSRADYHFNKINDNGNKRIELGTFNHNSFSSAFELACIYSVKGEVDRALDYLKLYKKEKVCPLWLITSLQINPMLDRVRESTEFEQILKDLENKYQKEHLETERILIREGLIHAEV